MGIQENRKEKEFRKNKQSNLFRLSFSLHFIAGLFCFLRVYRISSGEYVNGAFGHFVGGASLINAALLLMAGIVLVQYPFKRKSVLSWKDILVLIGILLVTDIIPALLS